MVPLQDPVLLQEPDYDEEIKRDSLLKTVGSTNKRKLPI